MVFSSALFLLIFFPVAILVYYALNDKVKNVYLLLLSLFFYSWGEPKFILLLLASIIINYLLALVIDFASNKQKKLLAKIFLITAIFYNLGLLFIFKYLDFAIANFNTVFSKDIAFRNIALPLGVSFFVFKNLSYIIDVYSKKIKADKNIINFGLYVSFFPQIISGPITRYSDFGPQIKNRKLSVDKLYNGIIRFMTGFSKKILIADQLASPVSLIFSNNGYSAPNAWIGAIAYTLEIYFDFSGYSDMAIGLGMMLGFETAENFNLPYTSTSVQDFWRRWHISLSSWFRDYVYIPLGGSRCSTGRIILNTTIVFFLTGLWHGASWNFIVWGLFYVVFLVIERMGFKKILTKVPKAIQHIYALAVIVFGWIFFRAESLSAAFIYMKNMFLVNSKTYIDIVTVFNSKLIICILMGILFSSSFASWIKEQLSQKIWLYNICVTVCFLIAIMYMWGNDFSTFLYAQF